jgi:hypothetical protein
MTGNRDEPVNLPVLVFDGFGNESVGGMIHKRRRSCGSAMPVAAATDGITFLWHDF